ncbi:gamma-glutamylcyclotransferase (GGCT)/AIG2-like uncharacterized protein YtfP [Planomicrobium soli]|uniref:Gamma-glutamylcyclotransferase (GGCT)/AIG2-like uncharacterized protein YtfP n=1 Tax=Planomicrobium soli TaxID=1176648 RepID=A0A2P8H1C2_9BACL|nr:gamma-glutamylcyclotransferase family protein [Planomicrobium soli]PSL40009.1 gamma-glutamylcyclotransferase (GGCT)/AIG2-like uncharacterized protein YtfP [Planomicrobium soli]
MKLFVYGSLKRGGKYHCYLDEATLIAEHAVAKGVLYDSGLGYPAIVLSGSDDIIGEIYDIPDELWPALDDLEGYTGGAETDLFDKSVTAVEVAGEEVEAVIYVAKDKSLLNSIISDGVWDESQTLFV